MSHPRLGLHPRRQLPCGDILGLITQGQGGQATQHQFGVVGAHAQAQTHVGQQDLPVQVFVHRHHRTHEHIGPATGVLGQRLHGHVHTELEGTERQPGAPGVVQRRNDRA